LSLAGFAYVFLLARTALMRSSRSLDDAARIQGVTSWRLFFRVSLPMLRPALAAALAVVVLHVLSDFGAVSMLGYETFTLSIYLQMTGRQDYHGATGLSLVLVVLSLMFLVFERIFRSRQRYYHSCQARLVERKPATRGELVLLWGWMGLVLLLSFGLPLAWMLSWTWQAMISGKIDLGFLGYFWNSVSLAAMAATVTLVVALPVAFYHTRRHSLLSHTCIQLSSVGFVLPGPVVALGVLSFVLAAAGPLSGTLAALVIALVIRFLPLAVQTQEAALQQLTPSLSQVGRTLGAGAFENLRRVILPMIRGGLVTAWVLVFIDTLKELPATLIMRPAGYDTLPVRIWIEASEEMLELAAPAALLLVVATLPVIWFLMRDPHIEQV
jgi:iron(III) transport system permease protein